MDVIFFQLKYRQASDVSWDRKWEANVAWCTCPDKGHYGPTIWYDDGDSECAGGVLSDKRPVNFEDDDHKFKAKDEVFQQTYKANLKSVICGPHGQETCIADVPKQKENAMN